MPPNRHMQRSAQGWEAALAETCTACTDAWIAGEWEAAEGWWKLAEWQQQHLDALLGS